MSNGRKGKQTSTREWMKVLTVSRAEISLSVKSCSQALQRNLLREIFFMSTDFQGNCNLKSFSPQTTVAPMPFLTDNVNESKCFTYVRLVLFYQCTVIVQKVLPCYFTQHYCTLIRLAPSIALSNPIFQQLSVSFLMSSSYIGKKYFNIVHPNILFPPSLPLTPEHPTITIIYYMYI